MTVILTQCIFCKHLSSTKDSEGRMVCAAFDNGPIPEEILYNKFDHRTKHPDDNGLMYSQKAGSPPHPLGPRRK